MYNFGYFFLPNKHDIGYALKDKHYSDLTCSLWSYSPPCCPSETQVNINIMFICPCPLYDIILGDCHSKQTSEWLDNNGRYHYCRHNNCPILHCWAVIRKSVLILNQHKLVYIIPVADLKEAIMKYLLGQLIYMMHVSVFIQKQQHQTASPWKDNYT